jgi:hypothetical protein
MFPAITALDPASPGPSMAAVGAGAQAARPKAKTSNATRTASGRWIDKSLEITRGSIPDHNSASPRDPVRNNPEHEA